MPYYWNIAPNRDATITPRVMSKRGVQLLNEFRYLEPLYRGELRYEVLPDDRVKNGGTRSALSLIHNQTFSYGWVGALNLQKVSDDNYFTDLSTQITATSQVLLPRTASLAKGGALGSDGSWGFSTSLQRWQTLQSDPLNPVGVPYSTAQFNLGAVKPIAGIADAAFTGNVAQFTTYLVHSQDIPQFMAWRLREFPKLFPDGKYPPNTLLIVDRLVQEQFLVEVQTIAAL